MSEQIRIRAPDGSIAVFPAGTPDETIEAAMRQAFPPGTPRVTAPGIGERMAMGAGDVARGIEQAAPRLRQEPTSGPAGAIMSFLRRNPNTAPMLESGPQPETAAQVDARIAEREQNYQMRRGLDGEPGFDWARMIGAAIPSVAASVALPAPAGIAGAVGQGAALGGVMSGLAPQPEAAEGGNYAEQAFRNARTGAVLGGAAGGGAALVGRAFAPNVRPDVRALDDAGVQMTPGQMAGGMVNRMEQGLSSVPIAGSVVRGARSDSIESFNRAVANRALDPIGVRVPRDVPAGRELARFVAESTSKAYDDVFAAAQPLRIDTAFARDVMGLRNVQMTPATRQEFQALVRDRVMGRLGGGQIEPDTFQTIRSDLHRLAREYRGSADPAQREMAAGFSALGDAFDSLFARSNPSIANQYRSANQAYSNAIRFQDAAAAQGAVDGVFTPAQFSAAVRRNDNSARRNAYARGEAPMQDLADAARNVLPQTVPDSGTPERAMLAALATGGNIMGAVPPAALLGLGGLYAAASPLGQRAIQGAIMAPRPLPVQAAGNALVRMAPALGASIGATGAPRPPE